MWQSYTDIGTRDAQDILITKQKSVVSYIVVEIDLKPYQSVFHLFLPHFPVIVLSKTNIGTLIEIRFKDLYKILIIEI